MAAAERDASVTSKLAGSLHRAQHSPPLGRERFGCGEGLCSSVRGRSSAWNAMMLPGGGVPNPSTLAVIARPALTARPDSDMRPSRTRSRSRASSTPWRTDSTRAVTRASPRTEHGAGAACATLRPQQKAREERGAAHRRDRSSCPCRATASAPTSARAARIGPALGCHCAPTNSPLNHAAAIHGSTHPGGAKGVPTQNTAETGPTAGSHCRPSTGGWRSATSLAKGIRRPGTYQERLR